MVCTIRREQCQHEECPSPCWDYYITFSYGEKQEGSFTFSQDIGKFHKKIFDDFISGNTDKIDVSGSGWYIDKQYRFVCHTVDGGNVYYQTNKDDIESMFNQIAKYLE